MRSLGILNRTVISTGGGVVLRDENRALLRDLGFVAWLTAITQRRTIDILRKRDVSWQQIGDALGTSRQAAWERFS